jgi:hypothetical protein
MLTERVPSIQLSCTCTARARTKRRQLAASGRIRTTRLRLFISSPQPIGLRAMVHLAQGDLAGARAALATAPDRIEPPALAAFLAS